MIVVSSLILDLLSEVIQFVTEVGGFDTGPFKDTPRDTCHTRYVKTEGLRTLTRLELVQEQHFIFCLICSASHVI